jgi:hypothetical protein
VVGCDPKSVSGGQATSMHLISIKDREVSFAGKIIKAIVVII